MVQGAKHMKSITPRTTVAQVLSPNLSQAQAPPQATAALGRSAHHHRHHPYWRGPYDCRGSWTGSRPRACSTRSAPCPAPWTRFLPRSASASCPWRAPLTSNWRARPPSSPPTRSSPYAQQLIFDRDPMMSWVEIPSIDVSMPIYHGTSEEVLMAGVGHRGHEPAGGRHLDSLRAHRALGHAQPEHVPMTSIRWSPATWCYCTP